MNQSYFTLELDTTPPQISIYAPSYTSRDIVTEIRVASNETLGGYQNVYAIDNNGVRHSLVFSNQGTYLIGEVSFYDYPIGSVTFYAEVEDDVGNKSSLVNRSMTLIESVNYELNVSSEPQLIIIPNVSKVGFA